MSVVIIYTCTPTNQPTNQPYRPRRLKGERMRTQRGCTSCTYLREHVSEHYYFCDFYSDVVLHLLTASEWEKFVWSLVVEQLFEPEPGPESGSELLLLLQQDQQQQLPLPQYMSQVDWLLAPHRHAVEPENNPSGQNLKCKQFMQQNYKTTFIFSNEFLFRYFYGLPLRCCQVPFLTQSYN